MLCLSMRGLSRKRKGLSQPSSATSRGTSSTEQDRCTFRHRADSVQGRSTLITSHTLTESTIYIAQMYDYFIVNKT